MVDSNAIENHDSNTGIVDRVLATFAPGEEVTPDALAPMDHFQGRGLDATRDLAALLNPQPGDHVLDLGCGIGGRRVKKLMRPADSSVSVTRLSVPGNGRVGLGSSLALGSTGAAERCPSLQPATEAAYR